jgi:hypothetical protein
MDPFFPKSSLVPRGKNWNVSMTYSNPKRVNKKEKEATSLTVDTCCIRLLSTMSTLLYSFHAMTACRQRFVRVKQTLY